MSLFFAHFASFAVEHLSGTKRSNRKGMSGLPLPFQHGMHTPAEVGSAEYPLDTDIQSDLTLGGWYHIMTKYGDIHGSESAMKLSEDVVPISYAKAHTAKLIDQVVESGNPVVITQNGRARAVVQDLKSYEQTQETLAMLKLIAQGHKAIDEGRVKPVRKAFADVRKKAQARALK
jgi:prevent-host-death family protein